MCLRALFADLKTRGDQAFVQIASSGGRVTEPVFINHASQHWGWSPHISRAAFRACDLDRSGALGRHEYLLLLAALVHYGEGNPPLHSATLTDLRIRTTFMVYHIRYEASAEELAAGCLPDAFDVTLSAAARRAIVRDLCCGDTHVDATLEALRSHGAQWHDGPDVRPLTFDQFKKALPTLASLRLSASDSLGALLRGHSSGINSSSAELPRLVLDYKSMQRPRNPRKRPWPLDAAPDDDSATIAAWEAAL